MPSDNEADNNDANNQDNVDLAQQLADQQALIAELQQKHQADQATIASLTDPTVPKGFKTPNIAKYNGKLDDKDPSYTNVVLFLESVNNFIEMSNGEQWADKYKIGTLILCTESDALAWSQTSKKKNPSITYAEFSKKFIERFTKPMDDEVNIQVQIANLRLNKNQKYIQSAINEYNVEFHRLLALTTTEMPQINTLYVNALPSSLRTELKLEYKSLDNYLEQVPLDALMKCTFDISMRIKSEWLNTFYSKPKSNFGYKRGITDTSNTNDTVNLIDTKRTRTDPHDRRANPDWPAIRSILQKNNLCYHCKQPVSKENPGEHKVNHKFTCTGNNIQTLSEFKSKFPNLNY